MLRSIHVSIATNHAHFTTSIAPTTKSHSFANKTSKWAVELTYRFWNASLEKKTTKTKTTMVWRGVLSTMQVFLTRNLRLGKKPKEVSYGCSAEFYYLPLPT